MAYKIPKECSGCDTCLPHCPTNAIRSEGGRYWIDPILCNNCEGYYPEPLCRNLCPDQIPLPYQAKKGRSKAVEPRSVTSPELFANGLNSPLASSIIVWEASNILAQRHSLPWHPDPQTGDFCYQRPINRGQGSISIFLCAQPHQIDPSHPSTRQSPSPEEPTLPLPLAQSAAAEMLSALDIRAACLHLIYAAHAAALEHPWDETFVISDRQIADYLGIDKRKDLSKPARLNLLKELALQPCCLATQVDWPPKGKIKGFSLEISWIWELVELQHHFQQDELGCNHLVGFTLTIRPGSWTRYFLNKQGCRNQTAFYQYGSLPKSLLTTVMSNWQRHEGATRMILWLLFKARMGKHQRILVPTLMRVAYGSERVQLAASQPRHRKRLLQMFESDLEILSHYGLKPVFDPQTYPPEIQPFWAKLTDIPEDAEDALDFWIEDGGSATSLTDAAPKGKWNLLMNARIALFEFPSDWDQSPSPVHDKPQALRQGSSSRSSRSTRAKLHTHRGTPLGKAPSILSGEQIVAMRKQLHLSQRELAKLTGKSQSWIRDIEHGRFQAKQEDQILLQQVLGMNI